MPSKLKIADLVASTSRYAKKAATAADKNANQKLSATEARSLPADLKDDYKRQARATTGITPESFARDQAAYVAASARRADKNKDGYLSVTEQAAMPADLQDNLASYQAHSGTGSTGSSFLGAGAGTRTKLDGVNATKKNLSQSATDLMATFDQQGGSQHFSAAWKLMPTALKDVLAHPENHADFMTQLLFDSTGTPYHRDDPTYYSTDQLVEIITTAAAGAAEMADDVRQTPDTGIAATTAGLTALMNKPGVEFRRLSWSNGDDAAFAGLFAFDKATGQITGFGWYNEP
jgi:hypothetical protein